LTIELKYIH